MVIDWFCPPVYIETMYEDNVSIMYVLEQNEYKCVVLCGSNEWKQEKSVYM